MPTLRYNDGIGRLNLLAARSLFPLTSREIRKHFCIPLARLFLLPPPPRLMRERKLERIALVVRIHDGRELVGEVLVEIFEQRGELLSSTPRGWYVGIHEQSVLGKCATWPIS